MQNDQGQAGVNDVFDWYLYPHLQTIGLEKGNLRSKLSKSRNIKNAVATFVGSI
jgi:hypothetical protein